MKFSITNNLFELSQDTCIVTGIFEDVLLFPTTIKIDNISKQYVSNLFHRKILNGTIGQTLLLYDIPCMHNQTILLVGCGNKKKLNEYHYRKIIHKIVQSIKKISVNKIVFYLNEIDISEYNNYWKIRDTVEIFHEKLYYFDQFKTTKKSPHLFKEIIFNIPNAYELTLCKKAIKEALAISYGINITKDLSNMPPNLCTPDYITHRTKKLSELYSSVETEILDAPKIKEQGMAAYSAVGQGSCHPPTMSIIKYLGHPEKNIHPIVLIGKGLTFDSGGISIKDSDNMEEMKYDMCGAAAVYAVICIAAQLKLPLNIIGILAMCENMISSSSLRPGDILTTLSGQTVEVLNTDAEGRLVLCDVLTYVERYNPQLVIDIATLTGACVVALGYHFSGLMSNNNTLSNELIQAGKQSKDYVWQLPLHEVLNKQLKSTYADMTNVGGRAGGAITAGYFLQKFAYKYNWAHIDIAGTAWISNGQEKRATGRPVSLLSQFLINKSNLLDTINK